MVYGPGFENRRNYVTESSNLSPSESSDFHVKNILLIRNERGEYFLQHFYHLSSNFVAKSLYRKEFLNSSVVEHSAVNRLVVGSNPTWGV